MSIGVICNRLAISFDESRTGLEGHHLMGGNLGLGFGHSSQQ